MTISLQSSVASSDKGGLIRATSQRGFSLLELMIVVAIIGILAAIAIPSYENSVVKTNRKAMTGCMLEAAQFMERFYTTNLAYNVTTGGVANAMPALSCRTDLVTSYTMTLSVMTATTYTVRATPIGRQLSKDTLCGVLTVDQTGAKTESGTAATATECWSK
ncbi:MAG: type IV pilin protein [Arenimonas sp.]